MSVTLKAVVQGCMGGEVLLNPVERTARAGGGPFEGIGVQTSAALLVGFLSVCVAEVALAVMLWAGAPHAAAVGYALLLFEIPFWIGFALPFGPLLGIARTGLLLLM